MKKDTLINLRINNELKEDFQEIVEREGFTMSQVLEACMKDIVRRDIIPLNIRSRIETKKSPMVNIPFIKECLEDAIKKYDANKISSVSLFGSYSKGTATASSDVDLFIEVDEGFSLFDLADLQNDLEKSLGKKVDLVTKNDNPYFMSHIQKEKIKLYEREP